MSEVKKCKNCGADTEFRVEGSTEGFFCTKCDWALVTTHIPEIAKDSTHYKMYLLSADPNNKDQIKLLSQVANINYLQARKMAREDMPLIIEGEAVVIDKARDALNQVSIEYDIKPSFPY